MLVIHRPRIIVPPYRPTFSFQEILMLKTLYPADSITTLGRLQPSLYATGVNEPRLHQSPSDRFERPTP